jgi:DNA-binding NarL/FixJ family response regulator
MTTGAAAPTVVLADDHPPTLAGIRAALEDGGFVVVGQAADGEEAVRLAVAHRPAVCMLDVGMPGMGGIAAAAAITEQVPVTAVVMLTVSSADEDVFAALGAGASGYLLKDTDPARLPFALRGVLAGEAALPRQLVARVLDEFRGRRKRRRLPLMHRMGGDLSEREWEVLELLGEGLATREVAQRLGIGDVTVRRHVTAVVRKLGVADRDAALRLLRQD